MAKNSIHNVYGLRRNKGERVYMDPVKHDQHWAWLRKKAQAVFRGEQWTLTIEQWFKLWDDSAQWENRGRHKNSSAVFMQDPDLGWHIWNVEVCNRSNRLRELNSGAGKGRPKKGMKNGN